MLFDVLFLMVLPAIFMLLSWSRSTGICRRTIVRYVRPGRRALYEIALSGAVRMDWWATSEPSGPGGLDLWESFCNAREKPCVTRSWQPVTVPAGWLQTSLQHPVASN